MLKFVKLGVQVDIVIFHTGLDVYKRSKECDFSTLPIKSRIIPGEITNFSAPVSGAGKNRFFDILL
jgi:hypothetical protein